MNRKIVIQFLALTFLIMLLSWGLCVVLGAYGIPLSGDYPLVYIPYMLGGFSPTIASYVVLKRNKQVSGFKEWLKNVFDVRKHAIYYIFTVCIVALFFVTGIIVSGLTEVQPFYMFFAFLPVMLFGGGLEEAGWRYILQPELEKKYGFILSAVIIAVIWFAWHIPLFYIPGTYQNVSIDLWMFAVSILGLAFSIGAIRKISGSVFLAVLAHSMQNAATEVFVIPYNWAGTVITTVVMIIASVIAVYAHTRKMKRHTL